MDAVTVGRTAERIASAPVRVVVARCTSQRSVKSACRSCVMRCPVDALAFGEQSFTVAEHCTGCGVCYAACPTGAVELAQDDDRALAASLVASVKRDPAGVARITCARAERPPRGALVLACLGRLTENVVVAALIGGASRVEIATPPCDGCEMVRGMEGVRAALHTVSTIAHVLGREDAVQVVEGFGNAEPGEPAARAVPAYSRRDFFRSMRHQVAAAVGDALPEAPAAAPVGAAVTAPGDNPRRRHLLELLAGAAAVPALSVESGELPFAKLRVNGNCVGCNVCEMVCPTAALRREETETTFALRFQPSRCVHCRVCGEACYTRAIRFESTVDVAAALAPGEVELVRFSKRRCEICGQAWVGRGETLCFACIKRRRLLARVFEQPEVQP